MAVVLALIVAVVWLTIVWATSRISEPEASADIELFELPGGDLQGAVDETLRLDSPEEVADDPALVDTPEEETQIEETIENVIELSEAASQQLQQQYQQDAQNTGRAGSATGTGRRALGQGPGESGLPREQRWFVRFSEGSSLEGYAQELDFFGIELGALLPTGKLVIVSNISSEKPNMRTLNSGRGENRLYMTWQGGQRKQADLKLFQKAGIDAGRAILFHFYPRKTEAMLARLEHDYANRPADQIRRTYFVVRRAGRGYQFQVTRQSFFR